MPGPNGSLFQCFCTQSLMYAGGLDAKLVACWFLIIHYVLLYYNQSAMVCCASKLMDKIARKSNRPQVTMVYRHDKRRIRKSLACGS